jgi:hypothetical protein
MDDARMRADCARCVALCCVSLAFDRSDLFAFDKPAALPCPHLTSNHRCGIHPDLERRGLAGCARYDCTGAGQRVTEELFGGRSWREDPALAGPMFDAFRAMRLVHELLLLLQTARHIPMTPEQARKRSELESALQPLEGWSEGALADFECSSTPSDVHAFLSSLRDQVPHARQPRRRLPLV